MTPPKLPSGVRIKGPYPSFECEVWWRAEVNRYANYDPFEEFEQGGGSHLQLELIPYQVVRTTPKGVVLRGFMGPEFFQLGNAIRQTAVPTIQLALTDLLFRKEKHVRMAKARLKDAETQYALTDMFLTNHWGKDRPIPTDVKKGL